jgi:Flp pilus assembly protein TadD
MNHQNLDNEELLRLALDATGNNNHADAVSMLKTLVERDNKHVFGTYLLAAEHAQLGMVDRAEEGFRRTVNLAPDFAMARFQLGQLLMVKGDNAGAAETFAPIAQSTGSDALPAFARALAAVANDDMQEAIRQLQDGLARPQEVPALTGDMQRMLDHLLANAGDAPADEPAKPAGAASLLLSNYGKSAD